MEYKTLILMHQNTPVAEVLFENKIPCKYLNIYEPEQLPIGTLGNNEVWQKRFLKEWYKSRAIPTSRPNILKIEEILGKNKAELFLLNSGISLTDTYWFKEKESEILWENINFYKNGFDPVFANYYLNQDINGIDSKTPDYTTDGVMEKCWLMIDEIPYLIKFDNKTNNILCANEVVFYKISEFLNITTTPYYIQNLNGKLGCICPSFIKDDTLDAVNAMQFHFQNRNLAGENLLNRFKSEFNFEKELSEMMTLDCIFYNKDRHEKNFGIIYKDNKPKEFIPLFDNGNILGASSAEYILQEKEHPILSDSDMMLVPWNRKQILENYGCEINIDKTYFNTTLQSVYEQFNIPEILYEYANKELNQGLEIYEEFLNTKEIER